MFKLLRAFLLIICLAVFVPFFTAADGRGKNDRKIENIPKSSAFRRSLETSLARRGLRTIDFCDEQDAVSCRVLNDYGAIFLTDDKNLLLPPVCIFANDAAVADFQNQMQITRARIGSATIELQAEAMNALLATRDEAIAAGLDITPRDGAEAARRDYADTTRLWNSLFCPRSNIGGATAN